MYVTAHVLTFLFVCFIVVVVCLSHILWTVIGNDSTYLFLYLTVTTELNTIYIYTINPSTIYY